MKIKESAEEETRALYGSTNDAEHLADYASQEIPPHHDVTINIQNPECGRERARRRFITVELIVIFVSAAYGGIATLSGQYVRARVSSDLYGNSSTSLNTSNSNQCLMGNETKLIDDQIQQVTSQWNLYLSTASTLPGMFSCLLIGTLSEQYGRRLAILLPTIGFFGQCIVDILVMYLTLPLGYLIIGSIFSGLSGNLALFMAGCFSYVTDITNEKQRMMRIVFIEILVFIGISVMQIGLGYLIGILGYATSLWIPFAALLVGVVNAGIPYLLIETVEVSQKTKGALTKALKDIVVLYRVKTDNRHILFMAMAILVILVGIGTQGSIAITTLYGQGQPFCWDSVTIGYFVTVSLAIPGVGCVIGASIFKRLKLGFMWIIQISLISATANMLVLGCTSFIQSSGLIFGSTVFGAFKLLGLPVVRAFLSTVVEENEYGALFSSLGVLDSVATFLATPIVNGIYYATVHVLSTAVFFFMAGMLIVPMIILGVLQCNGIGKKRPDKRPLAINSNDTDDNDYNETRPLINE